MIIEFITVFVISYIWHSLGVTVGYHRLISHRSFSCPKWVEHFWMWAGYLAFEGSPIWWATIHRAHHRYVDTPLDPHSPRHGGIYYAHTGWIKEGRYLDHIQPDSQAKDLVSDPLYRFLETNNWKNAHTLNFVIGMAFRLVILACFGWVAALANVIAAFLVLQIPLMLNVVCHIPKLGYKTYATEDDSVNVWWVALLAMGEGWHNNHHASPGSAKSGMLPWEVDMAWWTICLMKRLGLASRVTYYTHNQLVRKALQKSVQPKAPAIAAATVPKLKSAVNH